MTRQIERSGALRAPLATRLLGKPAAISALLLVIAVAPMGAALAQGARLDPTAVETTSAGILYERGANALRQKDSEKAVEYLQRAAALEPSNWEVLALYGRALLVDGDNAKAVEIFNRVEELKPDAKDLDFYRGVASYRLGRWGEAIRFFDGVSAERNASGRLHLYKGIAYQELQDYGAAEVELTEAAQLDPTLEGAANYRLGVMALEQRDVENAEKYLRRVEAAVPGSALARSAKGYLEQLDSGLYRPVAMYARLGGGYDSNASLQTGEFESYEDIKTGVGSGELNVSGLLVDTKKFDLRVGAKGFINFHGSQPAKSYDQILATGYVLGSLELSPRARLGFGYNFEYVWADYSQFRLTHAVEGSFRFIPYRNFVTSLSYSYQSRDYLYDLPVQFLDLNRDGSVQGAGFNQLWYTPDWTGWGRNYVMASFRFRHETSKGSEYDSNGFSPVVSVGIALPWKMFWTSSFSYEWRHFENPSCFSDLTSPTCSTGSSAPAGTADRRDRILRVVADLRLPVIESVFADVSYGYSNRRSNVPFYEYDRHLVQFLVTYRY